MMPRILCLFLLLTAPALAATTSTTTTTTLPGNCQHTTAADLLAAAANDPDWLEVMKYATRKHFDIANPANVVKCSEAPIVYFAVLKNLHNRPDAYLSYQPEGQPLMHTRLLYYKSKSRRVVLDVTDALMVRAYLNPDGTLRRHVNLDIHGHRLPSDTTATTLALPRGFL